VQAITLQKATGEIMLDQTTAAPIAQIKGLRVEFQTKDGPVVGVEDVSFDINPGETVCVVGESGSGKSVSSLSLMRLVKFRAVAYFLIVLTATRLIWPRPAQMRCGAFAAMRSA
jgi:ABC-type dipeptide/oligopeptide/nickel transport system ATPase component